MTYALIAANVIVFLFEVTMSQEQLRAFFELVAVIPAEYTAFAHGEPVPLLKLMFAPFASMFLHGGWMHLFGKCGSSTFSATMLRTRWVTFGFCSFTCSAV